MQDLIQFIFAGLTGGAIYALVALGFGVVHNTMGIVNFTQVDFVSLGGMILYSALVAGLPMAPALVVAVAGVTLVAILVEVVGIRPSRSENHLVLIFLTIGLSIILRGAMKIIWGKNRMAVPSLSGEAPVHSGGPPSCPRPCGSWPSPPWPSSAWCCFSGRPPWAWPCGGWPPTPRPPRWWASRSGGQGRELRPGRRPGGPGRVPGDPHHHVELRRGGAPGAQGLCRSHPGRLRFLPRGHPRGPHPGAPGKPGRGLSSAAPTKTSSPLSSSLLVLFIRPRGLLGGPHLVTPASGLVPPFRKGGNFLRNFIVV